MLLAVGAADAHGVAVDGAGNLAGDELALVEPAEVVAALRQEQRVRGRRRGELDADVPLAGEIGGRRRGCRGGGGVPGFDSNACRRSATIRSSPASIMYGVTETPVSGAAPPAAAVAMRGSPSRRARTTASPARPSFCRSH